jgi:hypothetical protein
MANDAASEQSQSTAAAISSGSPIVPRGVCLRMACATSLLRFIQPATGGVSIHPGQMAQMRGP